MSVTQHDLELIRTELEAKLATANLDHVRTANAIGAYGERFTAMDSRFDALELRFDLFSQDVDRRFEQVDRRFDDMDRRFDEMDRRFERIETRIGRLEVRLDSLEAKLDSRFSWQTFVTVAVGIIVLFGDVIRPLIGLG